MQKRFLFPLLATVCFVLAGCAKSHVYSGITFPATTKTQVVFEEREVPPQCRVFAQLIIHTPAGMTGSQIGDGITGFAQKNGADFIYIGLSRKSADANNKQFDFHSYGPKKPYLFSNNWFGWKYGYGDWEKGGNVVGFGYNRWQETSGRYDFSMKIQAVLLRCTPGSASTTK